MGLNFQIQATTFTTNKDISTAALKIIFRFFSRNLLKEIKLNKKYQAKFTIAEKEWTPKPI